MSDEPEVTAATLSINDDAKARLERAGLSVSRVVRVYPEAILYLNGMGRAMTAWAVVRAANMGRAITYITEPGFQADRSEYLED